MMEIFHSTENGADFGFPSKVRELLHVRCNASVHLFIQAIKFEVPTMYRETKFMLLAALISVPLFVHAETPGSDSMVPVQAGGIEAMSFQTPDDAAQALLAALESGEQDRLIAIFGSKEAELLSSGDEIEDKNNRSEFVRLASEKILMEMTEEGNAVMHVGNTDWPFPIPIVKTDTGWQFDAEQGHQEILNRRIGRNELSTVAAIRGYLEAQFEYANADRDGDGVLEYAQKLRSEPGKSDGLYWEAEEGAPQSPLGPLIAEAKAEGYKVEGASNEPSPYHGYYYRILTRQGDNVPGGKYDYVINGNMIAGFALVAYPAQYGSSGIMTFVVNHQGRIYQKDLGPKTAEYVAEIEEYNPDSTWEVFQTLE
jgi:hypothetical protein